MVVTHIFLAASILLCSLVAGLVFAFAIVIMPGIKTLENREYLRAFVVMDRIIQNNQPIFLFVWLGSAVSVIILAASSIWHLHGINLCLSIAAAAIYVLGVQLPTIAINIPLNNELQSLSLDDMKEAEVLAARQNFETRWNYWNSLRTVLAIVVSILLIVVALRI